MFKLIGEQRAFSALTLLFFAGNVFASQCETLETAIYSVPTELSLPSGFIDICSKEDILCAGLTAGFPPDMHTMAYLASPTDWARYKMSSGKTLGFKKYLIAQYSDPIPKNDFDALATRIRNKEYTPSEPTKFPEGLEQETGEALGMLYSDESVIVTASRSTFRGPDLKKFSVITHQILVSHKKYTLALYVYVSADQQDAEGYSKALTTRWLNCLGVDFS